MKNLKDIFEYIEKEITEFEKYKPSPTSEVECTVRFGRWNIHSDPSKDKVCLYSMKLEYT